LKQGNQERYEFANVLALAAPLKLEVARIPGDREGGLIVARPHPNKSFGAVDWHA
jgi:hypothetical protein